MEDGEIADSRFKRNQLKPGDVYEWPGEPSPGKPQPTCFRLVVLQTSVLSSKHKFAILDGCSELQLGRDAPLAGVDVPKVRLKEMEVSKFHATVYWDAQSLEWSIVDMGSKHGTFLKSATSLDDIGSRLSPPRMASVPKRLRHLDRLTIGSTTFAIHIHSEPCEACSLSGEDQIPLFHTKKVISATSSQKRSRETAGLEASSYLPKLERDPKKALNLLKQSLLLRHEQGVSRSQSPQPPYVDRSARRRALHPSTHSDSPGVQPPAMAALPSSRVSSPGPTLEVRKPSPEPTSQPAVPLPSSNIGHRLLMKQGWSPGMALGTSDLEADEGRIGLIEPVEVNPTVNRAGLGSRIR